MDDTERPIRPGDVVEHRDRDLDPRKVARVEGDKLTLHLLTGESPWFPVANYRIVTPAKEA